MKERKGSFVTVFEGKDGKDPVSYKEEDRWKKPSLFRKIVRIFTPEIPEINMPRYQPCPDCNSGSRRTERSGVGATYRCVTHGNFIVKSK